MNIGGHGPPVFLSLSIVRICVFRYQTDVMSARSIFVMLYETVHTGKLFVVAYAIRVTWGDLGTSSKQLALYGHTHTCTTA